MMSMSGSFGPVTAPSRCLGLHDGCGQPLTDLGQRWRRPGVGVRHRARGATEDCYDRRWVTQRSVERQLADRTCSRSAMSTRLPQAAPALAEPLTILSPVRTVASERGSRDGPFVGRDEVRRSHLPSGRAEHPASCLHRRPGRSRCCHRCRGPRPPSSALSRASSAPLLASSRVPSRLPRSPPRR